MDIEINQNGAIMGKWSSFERITFVWALALGTTALLTIFVGLGVWISDNSSSVASWVQAVGSIGAIAAGFGVASYQFAQADRRERMKKAESERVHMRNKCLAFSYRIKIFSSMTGSLVNNSAHYATLWHIWETDCEHLLDQLGSIPADVYPNPESTHEVGVIRVRLLAIVKTIKLGSDARKLGALGKGNASEFVRWAETLQNHAFAFTKYVEWLVARYKEIAFEMSTDEERERIAAHHARMDEQFGLGHLNPSDTGNPRAPHASTAGR